MHATIFISCYIETRFVFLFGKKWLQLEWNSRCGWETFGFENQLVGFGVL